MVNNKKHGFTLMEISIVVVIIALIIAGIYTGLSLMRTSQLRSVASEFASYTQAIGSFKDKYQALPGDFSGASGVWSGASNGDGNGLIVTNVAGVRPDEQFIAWKHLALAELIKGSFTGTAGSGGVRDRMVGSNIAPSSLNSAGWGLISVTLTDIAGGYSEIPYTAPDTAPNHVLWLGGRSVSATADSQAPVITGSEALEIDTKMDDGLPGSGKVIAQSNGSISTCSNSATAYNISTSSLVCALVFKTGY